ncbi:MAG: hypothetical protein J2O48_13675, partial [Solirubrobacterales bacterium]|nr:hypothetical protein [Solirubrobacterales bacterium]
GQRPGPAPAPGATAPCTRAVQSLRKKLHTLAVNGRHRRASFDITVSLPKGCKHYAVIFPRHVTTSEPKKAKAVDRFTAQVWGIYYHKVKVRYSHKVRSAKTHKLVVVHSTKTVLKPYNKLVATVTKLSNRNAAKGYHNTSGTLTKWAGKRFILRFTAARHGRAGTSFGLKWITLNRS